MVNDPQNTLIPDYTLVDLGYNQNLVRIDPFYDDLPTTQSSVANGVNPSNIQSGSLGSNLTVDDGQIKSANYVTGVSGWMINDQLAEFNDVTVRGTLIAGEIHIPDIDTTANSFHVATTGDTWWGCTQTSFNADANNAKAYVLKDGTVKFGIGTVGGWTLGATTLSAGSVTIDSGGVISAGTSNDIAKLSAADATYRLWIGNATAASAPFRVTKAGAVTATNITISGGSVDGSLLTAGSVTATKISVSTLSAISADLGTITAGTVTGATIKTAASGKRVEMSNNEVRVYDSSGTLTGTFSGSSVGGIASSMDVAFGLFAIAGFTDQGAGSGVYALGTGIDCAVASDLGDLVLSARKSGGGGGDIKLVPESGNSVISYTGMYPVAAGTHNLGDGTLYWNDVSYKTLTDRGCLGWFDEGVELQDGRVVSDTEALLAIEKDSEKTTAYGKPMLKYSTFPKVAFKPAQKEGETEGIEMTAVFSIMIGAINELTRRVKELEK